MRSFTAGKGLYCYRDDYHLSSVDRATNISEYDGHETLLYDIDRHKADEKAALHRFFLEEIHALLATHQSDREKLDGIQEILWSDHVYESPDSRESDGMKKMKRAKMGT